MLREAMSVLAAMRAAPHPVPHPGILATIDRDIEHRVGCLRAAGARVVVDGGRHYQVSEFSGNRVPQSINEAALHDAMAPLRAAREMELEAARQRVTGAGRAFRAAMASRRERPSQWIADRRLAAERLASKLEHEISHLYASQLTAIRRQIHDADASALEARPRMRSVPKPPVDTWRSRTGLQVPLFSARDRKLVELWAGRDSGRDDVARLMSARGAELALMQLLDRSERRVTDASVLQLTVPSGPSATWLLCDIIANDRAIDVKNARQSHSSPSSYSDFRVKSWKHRGAGDPVLVAGMFSTYHTKEELDAFHCCGELVRNRAQPSDSPFSNLARPATLWLGVVSHSALADVVAAAQRDLPHQQGGPRIRLFPPPSHEGHTMLPGWAFEYPEWFYGPAPGLESEAHAALLRACANNSVPASGTLAFALGCPELCKTQEHADEVRELVRRVESVGLSRPAVWLHVLARVLVCPDEDRVARLRSIRAILWSDTLPSNAPLGLWDPLQTIESLCACLEILVATNNQVLSTMTEVRLSGKGVLRGVCDGGRSVTLVAHCGGWKSLGAVEIPCGHAPLVLGREKPCGICGWLICPSCNWCREQCARCAQVRASLPRTRERHFPSSEWPRGSGVS